MDSQSVPVLSHNFALSSALIWY